VSNIPNCDRKCNPRARNYAVIANQPAGWCAHLLAMTGFSTRTKAHPKRGVLFSYATSHLYFSTLYKGINGTIIGTVFTYF
jgi:hypothetical protein